jgi:hypothetical protein
MSYAYREKTSRKELMKHAKSFEKRDLVYDAKRDIGGALVRKKIRVEDI